MSKEFLHRFGKNLGFLILVSLIFLACQTVESTPTPESLQNFLSQATTFIDQERYSEAVDVLEHAAEAHSESPIPLIPLGQLYLHQQRNNLAEDAFNRALARDLENPVATVGLAETYLSQGNSLKALSLWQKVSETDPDLPGVFSGLGRAYLARLEFDAAQDAFLEQLSHSQDAEAQWYLASLVMPTDMTKARAYLAAMPTDISDNLFARRDYLNAILEPFGSDAPQAAIAQAEGVALVQAELWPPAIHALQIASQAEDQTDKDKAKSLAFLGHALAQYGRPAIETFRQAEMLDPASALPTYFEGIYLRQKGALNVAEDTLQRAASLDPKNSGIYIELARVKTDQGSLADAETQYMAAVEAAPDDRLIQTLQVKFYADHTYRLNEAGIPAAEALVEADKENAEAYDLLGWMQFLAGDLDQAETNLRQAIELDPKLMSARYHLARYLESQGQLTEAEQTYRLITEKDLAGTYRSSAWEGVFRIQKQLNGSKN
ncbi:MAG: tetratricopeptide repeat protein [Anaerolineales bacterium]|nr:tetratricopeptide repeat protein [Anaerolineales bacterium]